jgi:hypothetical protein
MRKNDGGGEPNQVTLYTYMKCHNETMKPPAHYCMPIEMFFLINY